jgi:hypothetical protein
MLRSLLNLQWHHTLFFTFISLFHCILPLTLPLSLMQMSTSVNSLVTTFEKNILDSFTTETLEQAAQEIVDVRYAISYHIISYYIISYHVILICTAFVVSYFLYFPILSAPFVSNHFNSFCFILSSKFIFVSVASLFSLSISFLSTSFLFCPFYMLLTSLYS